MANAVVEAGAHGAHGAHGTHEVEHPLLYGLMVEFQEPEQLLEAARQARSAGYTRMDGYSPMPIEDLAEALGKADMKVPFTMLGMGILGAIGGFALLSWTNAVDYPLNIGGRPMIPWSQWIPITFECTVLLAAFSGVIGMIIYNGLPSPYHAVFNVPGFDRASSDRFFLAIERTDPRFELQKTRAFLETLGGEQVSEVWESQK